MRLPDAALPWLQLHRTDCMSAADYVSSVTADFAMIQPYLPRDVQRILDIGCGLAGIDVLLAHQYPDAEIHLLDGDGPVENWRGGFAADMKPFTSRAVAEQVLTNNGAPAPVWHDVGTKETLVADLVVSLLSWGWHYPLETYTVVAPVIICDLREPRGEVIGPITYRGKPKGYRCLLC